MTKLSNLTADERAERKRIYDHERYVRMRAKPPSRPTPFNQVNRPYWYKTKPKQPKQETADNIRLVYTDLGDEPVPNTIYDSISINALSSRVAGFFKLK